MKRTVLLILLSWMFVLSCYAQETIKLPPPDMDRKMDLMKAFADRKSTREYSQMPLSHQDVADLLWASYGINRPEEMKHTAPTAMNSREIDIYVCDTEKVCIYDPESHSLRKLMDMDLRPLIAGQQDFLLTAPLYIIIAADMSRFRSGDSPDARRMAANDAGIVSQNISLFCSGAGLATVPRAWMENEEISKILGLGPSCLLLLNHPVGYPVATAGYHYP